MNFNWGGMEKTPARAYERIQGGMDMPDLVDKFASVVIRDLDFGNKWRELTADIEGNMERLINGPNSTGAAEEIANRHEELLKKKKDLYDKDQQVAYILALAKEMKKRRKDAN